MTPNNAHVQRYFSRIYDECLSAPFIREMDLDRWTDTERMARSARVRRYALVLLAFMMLFAWPMVYMYTDLDIHAPELWLIGALLIIMVVGILGIANEAIARAALDTTQGRRFHMEWPGVVKRYPVSMVDAVARLSRTLAESDVGVRLFSVVLHGREGEPHGMVLITKRTLVHITVWKDQDDTDHTLVHIASAGMRGKSVIRWLQGIVDDCIAD